MLGFSFNGLHSSEFGVVMKSKNRPLLPSPKVVADQALAVDGVYDFSAVNPYRRMLYNEREITVECAVVCKDIYVLRKRAREIARWLFGRKGALRFDDSTDVFYMGYVANQIDLTNIIARIGSFTLRFMCEPFGYSRRRSGIKIMYGAGIEYGEGYEYGNPDYNRFALTANKSLTVENLGDLPVRPYIRLLGRGKNVKLDLGSGFIKANCQFSEHLIFDCFNMTAIADGVNVNPVVTGEFLELPIGESAVFVSADAGSMDVTLAFEFYPKVF